MVGTIHVEGYNMIHVIYEAIVGSRLYGMSTDTSDTDTKGIFAREKLDIIPSEDHYFGLMNLPKDTVKEVKNGLEGPAKVESVFYSIRKFMELCMKGNPTLIEVAFVPDNMLLKRTEISDEIMKFIRNNFMTKQTLKSYIGYFLDQKRNNSSTPKKSSHVFRIGKQAIDFAKTGVINPVLSGEDLKIALDIRHNKVDEAELANLVTYLDEKLRQSEKDNKLIDTPDEQAANDFLVYIHKKYYETYTLEGGNTCH